MTNGIQMYDIYSYYYVPFWRTYWFIGLVGLALVLGIFFLVRYLRARRGAVKISDAQLILSQIEAQQIDENRYKDFYYDVTYLLKRYLSLTYSIELAGKTDTEVIDQIKKTEVPSELIPLIEQVFLGPQAIKYAHESARANQMNDDKQRCITIIKCTGSQIGT